ALTAQPFRRTPDDRGDLREAVQIFRAAPRRVVRHPRRDRALGAAAQIYRQPATAAQGVTLARASIVAVRAAYDALHASSGRPHAPLLLLAPHRLRLWCCMRTPSVV